MKPKSALRSLLSIASSAVLTISYAHAATLYWDGGTANIGTPGNGVSGGTAGDWDTTLTNWDQGNALAHVAWSGTTDTAFFGGTAGTVTLTAPITVGGLSFFSNSGYTIAAGASGLTFGATTNHVRMLNVSGTTSTATISGTVTGSGSLVFTSVAPDVASTLTMAGAGGWSGTTQANAGFTLQLNAASTALLNTSGITLNGGTINQNYTAVADRIKDTAGITSFGGTLSTNNPNTAQNFTETIGAVTLESGQTNFVHSASLGSLTSQSLILASLTHNGTSAMNFASSGLLNTTKNIIVVTGATATTAGQIIGSWAATGNTTAQTDYAVYNGAAQVVPAGIAASAQTDWTTATDAYTANATPGTGTAGSFTLTGTRNITALKSVSASTAVTADIATDYFTQASHVYADGDVVVFNNGTTMPTGMTTNTLYFVRDAGLGGAGTYKLALTSGGSAIDLLGTPAGLTALGALQLTTGNNLGTTGILNASANSMYITGPGALTLPSATSDNLHVNAGAGPIVISAPITNNATTPGVLTLVKNGSQTLTLSSTTSNYSGGTVLNAGTLAIGNVSNIGGASANLTFGGTATLAPSAALNFSGGTLTVNAGAYGTITGNGATAFATTTGSGTLRYTSGANTNNLNLGNASGFNGNLQYRHTGNANYGAGAATVQFSSLGDGVGSVLQVGGGQSDSSAPGQRVGIVFNGGAALAFNNRQIELLPRIASNHTVQTTTLYNNSADAAHTWTIATNLSYQVDQVRSIEFAGSNTGNNAFNGVISDGNVGGTLTVRKDGTGRWTLGGNNTYTGSTSIINGHLVMTGTNTGTGTITVSGAVGATVTISGNHSGMTGGVTLSTATGTSASSPLLNINSNTALGTGTLLFGGGAATDVVRIDNTSLSTVNVSTANAITLNRNFTFAGTQSLNLGTGTATLGGLGVGTNRTIAVTNNTLTLNGPIAEAAATLGINKSGAGTLLLSGTGSTYSGATIVTAGTLAGIGANAFGDTSGISIAAASTATLSLRGDASTSFVKTTGGAAYAVTTTANGATINVDQATIAGTTAKTMAIGTLLLNTAITNGTTFTGANNTSLSIGAVTTGNSVSGTETLTNDISGGGSLTLASVSVQRTTTPTLAFAGTGNTNVTGTITQAAATALTQSGAGTLTLGGASSHTGGTTVSAGTLTINGSLADATMAVTGSTSIVNGTGTLTYNVNGVVADQAVVSGSGTINVSGLSVAVIPTGSGLTEPEYVLVDATGGTITGTFAGLTGAPGYTLNYGTANQVKLVLTGGGDPYTTWSGGVGFSADANNDGVKNGMAWVLGALNPNANAVGLLPTLDNTTDPDFFIFTYNRKDDASTDVNTTIKAEYGSDLAGWTAAVGSGDIIITPTNDGAGAGIDSVQVKIRRTLAVGGKLFARLNVVKAP